MPYLPLSGFLKRAQRISECGLTKWWRLCFFADGVWVPKIAEHDFQSYLFQPNAEVIWKMCIAKRCLNTEFSEMHVTKLKKQPASQLCQRTRDATHNLGTKPARPWTITKFAEIGKLNPKIVWFEADKRHCGKLRQTKWTTKKIHTTTVKTNHKDNNHNHTKVQAA